MNLKINVYDAMTVNPVSVTKFDTVQSAAQKMKENHVASLVVKEGDKFLGLLTEKDIARKLVAHAMDPSTTKVEQIMSSNVRTTSPTADVVKVISIMSEINQRQMPVLENGNLVGLLTMKDVLRVQPQLFGLIYENISLKEEDRKPLYQSTEKEGVCESCGVYTYNLTEFEGDVICPACTQIL